METGGAVVDVVVARVVEVGSAAPSLPKRPHPASTNVAPAAASTVRTAGRRRWGAERFGAGEEIDMGPPWWRGRATGWCRPGTDGVAIRPHR